MADGLGDLVGETVERAAEPCGLDQAVLVQTAAQVAVAVGDFLERCRGVGQGTPYHQDDEHRTGQAQDHADQGQHTLGGLGGAHVGGQGSGAALGAIGDAFAEPLQVITGLDQ